MFPPLNNTFFTVMKKSWEIENFLTHNNGRLTIDGVDSVELAETYGTPLFVFSESRIVNNINRIFAIKDKIECPLKVCYAAKAMSTLGILRAIRRAGADIEVNSGGELWKALRAGFQSSQIIFNGTSKEEWEIELAIKNNIYAIQADSVFELELIEKSASRLKQRANVSLRLVPEIESKTHSGLQTALSTSKFGMMPEEAFEAFARYRQSDYVNLSGIHLHIGSQNPDPTVYEEAFFETYQSLCRIHRETGILIEHINLGGGFPVTYLRDNFSPEEMNPEQQHLYSAGYEPAEALGAAWNRVITAAKADNNEQLLKGTTLLLEPGRSIIADAGICLTTVRNAKQRPSRNHPGGREHWLLTDAGFNILLSMETYKWYYHLISAGRAGEMHNAPYKLAGPLCDGGDVYFDVEGMHRLPEFRLLPENIRPGEVLALLNCGAYSLAQASQYNGRPLPPVILITKKREIQVIRIRETLEDLIRGEI